MTTPPAGPARRAALPEPWRPRVEVLGVTDGDTLHGRLDIGWGIVLKPRRMPDPGPGTVRCVYPDGSEYDAPETSTDRGRDAREFARWLITPGEVLFVVSFHLDAFGRTLGAVTLRDGRDWATVMTEHGFVK